MATLNTVTLGEFVRLADYVWQEKAMSIPQSARNSGLFREDPIPYHDGDTKEYNEIDREEYAYIKNEGDQAEVAKVQVGYSKIIKLVRYGTDIPITVEMRKRNKYQEVIARLTSLGVMLLNRLDLDLSHRITFGTATTYTNRDGVSVDISTGDGLALFSTAHTLRGSATTYRNRLANNPQVSKGALEGMEKLIVEETYNQFGEKMTVPFDTIWSTDDPNTVNTIRELLQSTAEISAPNAGVTNVYKGKYSHKVLPRVATTAAGAPDSTKAKYWGLASSYDTSAYLAMNEEPFTNMPSLGSNAEEVSTEDWTFIGRASYGIAICGARWIKFSSGDGTA